ncbi:uncharacterized protein LOC113276545 isoform X2 [Papaver somniferum]|uniref:uncharacterized protein LOC113276545 isoform X2 n=1 Tax=Papaver somniferum TaxID=3469 RepID=UPI000E70548D|nr:uncharacterized protein LOC113276545 isoform X2 [Papaver somniferum]XP_026381962.1 uncharacterized protein LOC113276545 isoform X2 [Papaver somniferum]
MYGAVRLTSEARRLVLLKTTQNVILENACSEQRARMSAMDSTSRNDEDMLDHVTLTYNREHNVRKVCLQIMRSNSRCQKFGWMSFSCFLRACCNPLFDWCRDATCSRVMIIMPLS